MKSKTLFRIHYVIDHRQVTFERNIDVQPFIGLTLYDETPKTEFRLELKNDERYKTAIFYNVHLKRYEVEVKYLLPKNVTSSLIQEAISNFTLSKWKCTTIKQDINDLILSLPI